MHLIKCRGEKVRMSLRHFFCLYVLQTMRILVVFLWETTFVFTLAKTGNNKEIEIGILSHEQRVCFGILLDFTKISSFSECGMFFVLFSF